MLTAIGSCLGRWPTFALAILLGLTTAALGVAVFLLTVMSWGGAAFVLPASILAAALIASGLGLMLRASWWVDRAR